MPTVFLTASPLPLWLLAAAGTLLLFTWIYLWLFHHRFWTTRIPPVAIAPRPARAAAAQPAVTTAAPTHPVALTLLADARGKKTVAADTNLKAAQTGQEQEPAAATLPIVRVVIPARDEAEVIARTVTDVLLQDYAGSVQLVVVNDNSADATAQLARAAAQEALATLSPASAARRRFNVIDGAPLPAGWSGKLWALEQGIRHGLINDDATPNHNDDSTPSRSEDATPNRSDEETSSRSKDATLNHSENDETSRSENIAPSHNDAADNAQPQYLWLTDADISHEPHVLRELIERARSDNRALVSRMALLCTDTAAERWTIPAFVYFFQMLYPFAAVANERTGIHGAAGGCILLERTYLDKIGGIAALRGALIDDCTLADCVARAGGRLSLELTRSSRSQRGYGGSSGVSNMIARTAYTQLRYSPLRLLGTVFGLLFTFFAPLLLPLCAVLLLMGSDAKPPQGTADLQVGTEYAQQSATTAHQQTANAHASLRLPAALAIATPLAAAAILCGTFVPMLRFYRLSPLRALALPLIASFYLYATLKSAARHYRGKTGNWKGRVYQPPA